MKIKKLCLDTLCTKKTKISPLEFSQKPKDLGVGEIMINSIDRDGMMKVRFRFNGSYFKKIGYTNYCVWWSRNFGHLVDLYKNTDVAAAACSSIFISVITAQCKPEPI